jgi:hypothetical protein
MKLGLRYEVQIPKPWTPGIEARTYGEVIEQVVLADQLGWGYVWAVVRIAARPTEAHQFDADPRARSNSGSDGIFSRDNRYRSGECGWDRG